MRRRIVRNNKTVKFIGRGIKSLNPTDTTPYTNLEKLKNELKNVQLSDNKKLKYITL